MAILTSGGKKITLSSALTYWENMYRTNAFIMFNWKLMKQFYIACVFTIFKIRHAILKGITPVKNTDGNHRLDYEMSNIKLKEEE